MSNLKIEIDNACSRKWDEMTPSSGGRFCDSCDKIVLDFTTYSTTQLQLYFRRHTNVCGRITTDQLRSASLSKRFFPQLGIKLFLASLLFLFTSTKSFSQKATKEKIVQLEKKPNRLTLIPIRTDTLVNVSGLKEIKVRETDLENLRIIFIGGIVVKRPWLSRFTFFVKKIFIRH